MDGVMAAWLLEVGILSVRDLAGHLPEGDTFGRRPPYPWELLSSAIVFGALSVIAQNPTARRPANAVAWGLVVATFLSSQVDFLKPVSDFLSGGYAKPSASNGASLTNTSGGNAATSGASGLTTGLGGTPGQRGGQQP